MTPLCDDKHHQNMAAGRCPICHRVVATNIPEEEEQNLHHKSLRDSEDLRKILP